MSGIQERAGGQLSPRKRQAEAIVPLLNRPQKEPQKQWVGTISETPLTWLTLFAPPWRYATCFKIGLQVSEVILIFPLFFSSLLSRLDDFYRSSSLLTCLSATSIMLLCPFSNLSDNVLFDNVLKINVFISPLRFPIFLFISTIFSFIHLHSCNSCFNFPA